jgi:Fe-S oxidoreductase
VATGYSCRSQVKRIDGIEIAHPVQALLELLTGAVPSSSGHRPPATS